MRDLDENAAAVAQLRVGADSTTMIEIEQDLQALLHDAVRLAIMHVGDEADTAGIVFMARIEEALGLGKGRINQGAVHDWRSGKNSGGGGNGGILTFGLVALRAGTHPLQSPGVVTVHHLLRPVEPHRAYSSPPHNPHHAPPFRRNSTPKAAQHSRSLRIRDFGSPFRKWSAKLSYLRRANMTDLPCPDKRGKAICARMMAMAQGGLRQG